MNQDVWVSRHPYLQPVADLHTQVTAACADGPRVFATIPNWDDYDHDYHRSVPLLASSCAGVELQPAEEILVSLLAKLGSLCLPQRLVAESRELDDQLHSEVAAPQRALQWLLGTENFAPAHPGLLRYLGWTALARYLYPIVDGFSKWRDEELWLRPYCPTCGSAPSMSQLVEIDSARRRLLSCGCCGTRWQYRRMSCPFCETTDTHRLSVLAIEGEGDLRIEYCESCRAYLKTYIGAGSETVFLADWTSFHLDIIALDRGLKRLAGSLYEL